MPPKRSQWVLLAFRLAREPSTPRIAVWRKLQRLGAARLLDGLVALPLDDRNRQQLDGIAENIADAGGEATIWVGELSSAEQERQLVARMQSKVAADYRRLIDDVESVRLLHDSRRRRSVARLHRELHHVRQRDYFPTPEGERAQQAVDSLGAPPEEVTSRPVETVRASSAIPHVVLAVGTLVTTAAL